MAEVHMQADFTPDSNDKKRKSSLRCEGLDGSRRSSLSTVHFDFNLNINKPREEILFCEGYENSQLSGENDCSQQLLEENRKNQTSEKIDHGDFNDDNIVECKSITEKKKNNQIDQIQERILFEIKEAFKLFDINSDGLLTHCDLQNTFVSLGMKVPDQEISKMLDDATKPLDLMAFIEMIGSRIILLDPENVVIDALSKWDSDNLGLIPLARIRHDLMSSGDQFTEEEVELALEEAPLVTVKGKHMVDYGEFCKIIFNIRKY